MPKEKNQESLGLYGVADLSRRLPRGYAKQAVKKLQEEDITVSETYVRNVKAGRFYSHDVINMLETLAKEEDERLEKLKSLDEMKFTPQKSA